MNLVPRSEWGARNPRERLGLNTAGLRGMAVHYSGGLAERKEDHAACDDVVRSIQNFHMDGQGWVDIAYSFLPCMHGYVYEGRGWGTRTAANGTNAGNAQYHAVCFLGGDKADRDDVTDAGRLALHSVIAEGKAKYPHAWEVRPHSDFRSTACPGNEIRDWLRAGMPVNEVGARPADMPTGLIVVNSPPVALMGSASGGYWIVCEDGGVFNFGGAGFFGSLGGVQLNAPIIDMASSPSGQGYILFSADGGVFTFGDAEFSGSLGGVTLNQPVVDAAITADGTGYWLLGRDGGIFAFDAPYGGRIEYRG